MCVCVCVGGGGYTGTHRSYSHRRIQDFVRGGRLTIWGSNILWGGGGGQGPLGPPGSAHDSYGDFDRVDVYKGDNQSLRISCQSSECDDI